MSELKERGIAWLLAHKEKDKEEYEFNSSELSEILGILPSSVYEHMEALVKEGTWKTRMAFDPEIHKTIKVWWLAE